MKKLYLLLVAALISLSAGAQDYYLIGQFNGWALAQSNCKFTDKGDGTYELDYNGTLTNGSGDSSGFKINNGTWDNVFGAGDNNTITVGETYSLGGGGNIQLESDVENPHLVFNPEGKTLLITGEVAEPEYTYAIKGDFNLNGQWTQKDLTLIDGKWVGTIEIENAGAPFGIPQLLNGNQKYWIWASNENESYNITDDGGTFKCVVEENNNGHNFTIDKGLYTFTFDPEDMTLTVSAPQFTYALYGQFMTSAFDNKLLTENEDGTWSAKLRVRQDQRFDIRKLNEDGSVAQWIIPDKSQYEADQIKVADGRDRILITKDGNYPTETTSQSNNTSDNNNLQTCFVIPAGVYWFTYNPENNELVISGGQFDITSYTIYYNNTENWTSVNAFVWDGNNLPLLGNFPGNSMTSQGGTDYILAFSSIWSPQNVIFSDGSDENNKTADFRFKNRCVYDYNGVDETYWAKNEITYTVKFNNSETNWNKVFCYVYDEGDNTYPKGTTWPGVELENPVDGIYTFELKTVFDPKYVIFNNGNSGVGTNQTAEFIFVNNMTYKGTEMSEHSVTCINSEYEVVYCYAYYFEESDPATPIEITGPYPGVRMKNMGASVNSAMMREEATANKWEVTLYSNQTPQFVQFNNGVGTSPTDEGAQATDPQLYSPDAVYETTGVENVVIEAEPVVEYYNLQGIRVANPTRGLYIRRCGNTATKVIL